MVFQDISGKYLCSDWSCHYEIRSLIQCCGAASALTWEMGSRDSTGIQAYWHTGNNFLHSWVAGANSMDILWVEGRDSP
jgi:hypothetical protein